MSFILAGAIMGAGEGLVKLADEKKKEAAEKRDIELERHKFETLANDPEATRSQRARARSELSTLNKAYGGGDRSTPEKTRAGKATGLPRRGSAKSDAPASGGSGTSAAPKADRPTGLGTRPVSRDEGTQPEAKSEIERLASLSPEAYEAQRRKVADRLGWRLSALDAHVKSVRSSRSDRIDTVPDGGKPSGGGDTAPRPTPQATPAVPQDRAAPTGPNAGKPEASSVLDEARAAIRQGAPRDAVVARLRELGVDPKGL